MFTSRFILKVVKVVFTLCAAGILVVKIHRSQLSSTLLEPGGTTAPSQAGLQAFPSALRQTGANDITLANIGIAAHRPSQSGSTLVLFNQSARDNRIDYGYSALVAPSVDDIRRIVEDNNLNAEIFNEDKFGPASKASYVVVVQVHNRLRYLEKLVQSLELNPLINWVLLIFSHDYFSVELNQFVRSIKFCRVMQIFYPNSIQLSPASFPGRSPTDCAATMSVSQARAANCQIWQSPDRYGHYRNADLAQIKHHWWWKVNYVFDGIPSLRQYDGWVVFLEEDHYVSPDFLYSFNYFVEQLLSVCRSCHLITLGTYLRFQKGQVRWDEYAILPWFSSYHNMGMAFNRSTWDQIRQCAPTFCKYDDYNWDWSLLQVSNKCMKKRLTTLMLNGPRVFHIGDCGVHHKGKICTADSSADAVVVKLKSLQSQLFPKTFKQSPTGVVRRLPKQPKENGGWGDPRDHDLCLNSTFARS
uniref:Alpha-1,6-mannosyl-glycoprotein 2-beta-N-acetylglucosaminyltransferase n=1 Tax=Trichuris muris TaxID=70415 RepID=A0A5S6Q056_TRIMR